MDRRVLVFMTAAVVALCSCSSAKDKGSKEESGSKGGDAAVTATQAQPTPPPEDIDISDGVVFSYPSGFYSEPVTLELYAAEGTTIRYTTDGSLPDASSMEYTAPLTLNDASGNENVLSAQKGISASGDNLPKGKVKKGNVIRAAAFDQSGNMSAVSSATYFVGLDREKLYGDVPVISLITDQSNLFDYETGIYVMGKTHDDWLAEDSGNKYLDGWQQKGNYSNKGREWERPVYAEYICPDGTVGFGQDMGVRIMGAASRNSPQKSLRLIAREDYGKKAVEFEVIPDNLRSDGNGNVTKYKSFVLRNGGNDCDYAKIRDPFLQSLVSDKGFETQQTAPCVVFLDGEYWGMYTITEDYNDNYIENNYDIDNKNVVIVKCGEIEEGEEEDIELYNELYDFITGNDMSDPENYAKAGELLELQGFADYCAMNLYVYNEDSIFEGNNWRMWRVRETSGDVEQADGRWRMMLYDTDYSTGIYSGGGNGDRDNITDAVTRRGDRADGEREPCDMLRALLENEDFRQMFVISLCDMRNISYEWGRAAEGIAQFDSVYKKLVPETFKRFGPSYANYGNAVGGLKGFMKDRYDSFLYCINDAFKLGGRCDVTVSASDSAKGTVIMNTTALDLDLDFTGKYFKCYPVTLTAVPAEGCMFSGWECEGCEASSLTDETITVSFEDACSIKAVFE